MLWTFKEGWLKNDDSEALLVINQTLGNQQAVIDSLQASLASQDTQLDSTMIADMIAAAGGFGSGGGCDYTVSNPKYPQGLIGETTSVMLTIENNYSYTVPVGKNIYVYAKQYCCSGQNMSMAINGFNYGQSIA